MPGPANLRRRPQLPGRGAPVRDGPVEPRHDPDGAAFGRLRLPRPPPQRLQPHPPEWRGLRGLRRFPVPADDRSADRLARAESRDRAWRAASSRASRTSTRAARRASTQWSCGRGGAARSGWPDGDDADRFRPLHLPGGAAAERPDRRRRQRPARRRSRRPARPGEARNHRQRLERPLLRPASPLQGLLRGAFRPRRSRPRAPGPKDGSNRGATPPSDTQSPPQNPQVTARAGAYATFDTRRDRTVDGAGRHLLRQRRGRPRRAPRRKRRPRLRRVRAAARQPLGPGARQNQRQRRLAPRRPRPSTRRSTTRCSRRGPSTTSAATTSAWTARSTAPPTAPSTPTSPAGTSTAPRSRCWR